MLLVATLFLFCLSPSFGINVDTEYGPIQGETIELHSGKRVNTFLGIPFAKPPVGSRRFAKPEKPDSWTETFVADRYGPSCPQDPSGMRLTNIDYDNFSEDCLTLNIFTPEEQDSGPYSVMVFFHGGGYNGGGSAQYPGPFLAAKGVVLVVPNYRLGILGFSYTKDGTFPGNQGIWDQHLVLEFVQANIQALGGDPNKVTIFGESAGAGSVGVHLVSPLSKGLFQGAICQSGNEYAPFGFTLESEKPENYIEQVALHFNCTTEDKEQMVACLRLQEAEDLITAPIQCTPGYPSCNSATLPVIDGVNGLLPKSPQEIREAGEHSKVPLMSGFNTEDGSMFSFLISPDTIFGGINNTVFKRDITAWVNRFKPALANPNRTEDIAKALIFNYSPWPHIEDLEANRGKIVEMYTDWSFAVPQQLQVEEHSKDVSDIYHYVFGYLSSNATAVIPEYWGVPHILDLPYVFGWTLMKLNLHVVNQTENFNYKMFDWNSEDEDWTDFMTTLWTNFAKHWNPTPDPVQGPGMEESITWEPYQNNKQMHLSLARDLENRENYRPKYTAFWRDYMKYLGLYDLKED